jgi:hypothetical protein
MTEPLSGGSKVENRMARKIARLVPCRLRFPAQMSDFCQRDRPMHVAQKREAVLSNDKHKIKAPKRAAPWDWTNRDRA